MVDKLYVVYSSEEVWYDDDWSETVYKLENKYFTDEDQAELCADYLEMVNHESYYVQEVTNGDNIDFKTLIEEHEEKMRIREINDRLKAERQKLSNYALEKSRIEGGDWMEIYHDLLKQRGLE